LILLLHTVEVALESLNFLSSLGHFILHNLRFFFEVFDFLLKRADFLENLSVLDDRLGPLGERTGSFRCTVELFNVVSTFISEVVLVNVVLASWLDLVFVEIENCRHKTIFLEFCLNCFPIRFGGNVEDEHDNGLESKSYLFRRLVERLQLLNVALLDT